MANELALQYSGWGVMKEQANVMLKSGFLPPGIRTAEQCIAVAMTGRELGIGFMEAVRSIHVIAGKPTLSPQLMLALANRTKELEDLKIETTDNKAVVTIKRKGRSPHTSEFGIKEATELQLMKRDNYLKQPKTMFTWRALAANLRITFPDVVLGLYTPEELEADVVVTDQGDMTVAPAKPTPAIESAPIAPPQKEELPTEVDRRIEAGIEALIQIGIPLPEINSSLGTIPNATREQILNHLTELWKLHKKKIQPAPQPAA